MRYFITFILFLSTYFITAQELVINELMASNSSTIADEDDNFEDWIELYNPTNAPINLEGYGLSDDPNLPFKWLFPNISIAPNGYLLVWASDKNRTNPAQPLHTNFKISASGDPLSLTKPDGTLIDNIAAVNVPTDVSYGRGIDSNFSNYFFYYSPTPNAPNSTQVFTELITPPVFSHDSGFYNSNFTLSITHPNPNAVIIYTTDGSDPDINNLNGTTYQYKNSYPESPNQSSGPLLNKTYRSQQLNGDLLITDRTSLPNSISTISSTNQFNPNYLPTTLIRKGTVVKVKAYINDVPSITLSNTYFVWASGNPFTLPVVSLIVQEDNFFDYNKGVYVAGVDFDNWRLQNPTAPINGGTVGNFRREDRIPVNVQYFDGEISNNAIINQNAGFNIHGNFSRSHPLKTFRLYASNEIDDENEFQHDFFKNQVTNALNPNNNKFSELLFRGQGGGGNLHNDVVFTRLMQPVYNGVARFQPVIGFVNGEFWGISFMRDRLRKEHWAYHFNLIEDNVITVQCRGDLNCEIQDGDALDYQNFESLRSFILTNDMSIAENYAFFKDNFDVQSYIDHLVTNIFAGNTHYEPTFWKVRSPENDNFGDGKWRVSLNDLDVSTRVFSTFINGEFFASIGNGANLHRSLQASPEYKLNFINRFADHLNTTFIPSRFQTIINDTFSEIQNYLPEDARRWSRNTWLRYSGSIYFRDADKNNLTNWSNQHPTRQRNDIINHFLLTGSYNLTVNVANVIAQPAASYQNPYGYVKVNTIELTDDTPGVPSNTYPWTGVYFNNVPITLEAKPYPGYVFSHWSGVLNSTDSIITLNLNQSSQIMAHFVPLTSPTEELVHYWHFNSLTVPAGGVNTIIADYTAVNQATPMLTYAGTGTGYIDEVSTGSELNLHLNELAGKAARVRNPSGDRSLVLDLPTTGYQDIKFSYSVTRTNSGQLINNIAYSLDGTNFIQSNLAQTSFSVQTSYELINIDFSGIEGANNNPNFKIQITFEGNTTASNGNNRLDNITLKGIPYQNNETVIQYWVMNNNIPNDTPLTSITATYTLTPQLGVINFESAFVGYPFTLGHPNWRKASMERRNSPTAFNYFPEANNNLSFTDSAMRGIQIKQPFEADGNQNKLVFNTSTQGFQDIKLSFAVIDEGAAQGILAEYFDTATNAWTSQNIINSTSTLSNTYQVISFDFSSVTQANNNPNFQIRLKFTGNNMSADNGNRVTFNNVAIIATPYSTVEIPIITSTTNAYRCGTGSVTLEATSNGGTINWYAQAQGGASLGTGNTFVTPSITQTTTYYIDAIGNQSFSVTRTPVVANISSAIPVITSSTPAVRCNEGSLVLQAFADSSEIRWFADATSETPIAIGNQFTTPILNQTTFYYVQAVNGCGTSIPRTLITATINTTPQITQTNSAERCGEGSLTLEATSNTGIVRWYASPNEGLPLAMGNVFNTPQLTQTTTFYAEASNGDCVSNSRVAVTASVFNSPIIETFSGNEICFEGSATIQATSNTGDVYWYGSETSQTPLFIGSQFTTPNLTQTTTYYAQAVDGNCVSQNRQAVKVLVLQIPQIVQTIVSEKCGEGSLVLEAFADYGTVNWYNFSEGGSIISTGNTFTTPNLTQTTTFYAEAVNVCGTSLERVPVIANIIPLPTIANIIENESWYGNSVTLEAIANQGFVRWYSQPQGGTPLITGNVFTTPLLTETTVYYAQAINSCGVSPRVPVQATITSFNENVNISLNAPTTYYNKNTLMTGGINWQDNGKAVWVEPGIEVKFTNDFTYTFSNEANLFTNHGFWESNQATHRFFASGNNLIAGNIAPKFYNLIIGEQVDNLYIANKQGIEIYHSANFENVYTKTPRNVHEARAVKFMANANFTGIMSNDRFIDGYVSKSGNTAFTFPVGHQGLYMPLQIDNIPNESLMISTAWFSGDPSSSTDTKDGQNHPITSIDTNDLNAVSGIGQWDWITNSSDIQGITVSITVPTELANFSTNDNLRLVGWNGNKWVNLSGNNGANNGLLSGNLIPNITSIGIGRGSCELSPSLATPTQYAISGMTTKAHSENWLENIPNAFLVLDSSSKAFVITRTTSNQIINPVEGMLIYDIGDNCFKLYNGTNWNCIEKKCLN